MIQADLGEWEAVVARLVATGRYASAAEVLREGVRLVEARAALDAGLRRGLADEAAGRVEPASAVLDRLEAKYREMAERR